MVINARRVRRRIQRSPNLRPRGTKERLLYLAWLAVIAVWVAQPVVMALWLRWAWVRPLDVGGWAALGAGAVLVLLGQAGTIWCYRAMGSQWRIGVRPKERTELVQAGPYAWVRHPIYSFQMLMLLGVVVLLPTLLSLAALLLHIIACHIKALDEEAYLLGLHQQAYALYRRRTGRFAPWRGGALRQQASGRGASA